MPKRGPGNVARKLICLTFPANDVQRGISLRFFFRKSLLKESVTYFPWFEQDIESLGGEGDDQFGLSFVFNQCIFRPHIPAFERSKAWADDELHD